MDAPRFHRIRLLLPLLLLLLLLLLGCQTGPIGTIHLLGLTNISDDVNRVTTLTVNSPNEFLVQVFDGVGKPAANAPVDVKVGTSIVAAKTVFSGTTDVRGIVPISFMLPDKGQAPQPGGHLQTLTVAARISGRTIQIHQPVTVGEPVNTLITTDKPIYQPGQTIHVRSLTLNRHSLHVASQQPLQFRIEDDRGYVLLEETRTTSAYGIASIDFPLDAKALEGYYRIKTIMGTSVNTQQVEVKAYQLPRFKVTLHNDKPYYLIGDTVRGTLQAAYFFGKPVAHAQITIQGVLDTSITGGNDPKQPSSDPLFELTGVTDADGSFAYAFPTPTRLAEQIQEQIAIYTELYGNAGRQSDWLRHRTLPVNLTIQVVNVAQQSETTEESITLAAEPILVYTIPESGILRPGLENMIYVNSLYPDGTPAPTTLQIKSNRITQTISLKSDEYGLAAFKLPPSEFPSPTTHFMIAATDAKGTQIHTIERASQERYSNHLLARPAKAQLQAGESLEIELFAHTQKPTTNVQVYLTLDKDGQSLSRNSVTLQDGYAKFALPLDGGLRGTVAINAYLLTNEGVVAQDQRLVLINPAPAKLAVSSDAKVYKPGDTATLDIQLSQEGQATTGAIGLSIVDESVLAQGMQDPGFARTYFLLERELLEPQYGIHDFVDFTGESSVYEASDNSLSAGASQQIALFGYFGQALANQQLQTMGATPTIVSQKSFVPHLPLGRWDKTFLDIYTASAPLTPLSLASSNRLLLAAPLVGFVFYNGSHKRRRLLGLLLLVCAISFLGISCAGASSAPPPAAPPAAALPAAQPGHTSAPRLRQFFPETLYWLPEVETDAHGHVQIEVPIADNITTWRASVVSVDQAGNLGSAMVALPVFQDFFIEPELPPQLTVGDEITAPVTIFNYLAQPQAVRLQVAAADWFELLDKSSLTLQLQANEVAVAYLPIRVTKMGIHDFKVTAQGSQSSDAVQRQVEVYPNGRAMTTVANGELGKPSDTQTDDPARQQAAIAITTAQDVIPGSQQITVKLYTGLISQLLGGLASMAQQPQGYLEQVSSGSYPYILALDYLQQTQTSHVQLQAQAAQQVELLRQRLLSFAQPASGGFFGCGSPQPQPELLPTANALMVLVDMGKVTQMDRALLERIANYLISLQSSDGSWHTSGSRMVATALVTWALVEAGYTEDSHTQAGLRYLGTLTSPPSSTLPTPYTLALVANALTAANMDAQPIFEQLIAQASQDSPAGPLYWQTSGRSWTSGRKVVANLETTALVALALLRANYRVDVAQSALAYLYSQRAADGSFHSTQATALSLKALFLAEAKGLLPSATGKVTIGVTGQPTQTIPFDGNDTSAVQIIHFNIPPDAAKTAKLTLSLSGTGIVQYQVVNQFYTPWSLDDRMTQAERPENPEIELALKYDKTTLHVNDTVRATALITVRSAEVAAPLQLRLGVPPGFTPDLSDLRSQWEAGVFDHYTVEPRGIVLWIPQAQRGQTLAIDFRLQARYPVKVQTFYSAVYEYYTPDHPVVVSPQLMTVLP